MDGNHIKKVKSSKHEFLFSFHCKSEEKLEWNDCESTKNDLTLIVSDCRFTVNRELLSRKSDYFNAMLQNFWAEGEQTEIAIEQVSSKLFSIVVNSFTEDVVRVSSCLNILEIYDLIHLYQRLMFTPPAEVLIKNLFNILDIYGWDRVWQLFDVVATSDDDEITNVCLKWIERNHQNWPQFRTPFALKYFRQMSLEAIKKLLDYNSDIPEDFFLIACIKWIKHNCSDQNEALALLNKIRVPFLSWRSLEASSSIVDKPYLLQHLHSMWSSQMRSLLNVDQKLTKINEGWKCDIAKDVCYTPNLKYVSMRGFCLFNEDIVYPPLLFQRLENHSKDNTANLPFIIDLRFPFWINELRLELSNNPSDIFRYVLECSVDGVDWDILFDYRKYMCSSTQLLIFKPTVIRFFRLSGLVQQRLKSHISRPIDSIHDLKAFYRHTHNSYSYGLRQGLYFSPYHICMMKVYNVKSTTVSNSGFPTETLFLLIEQPVLANKFYLGIPSGYQICYTFEIFNSDTQRFDIIYDCLDKHYENQQEILFTDRPVNLIRIVIKNIISNQIDNKNREFRFKYYQFFTLKEIHSVLPVVQSVTSQQFP